MSDFIDSNTAICLFMSLISENNFILLLCKNDIAFISQPRALSEKDLPSLEERAKIIKSQGALAINQIHHGGALAIKEYSS